MVFLKNTSHDPSADNVLLERYRTTGDVEALGTLYARYLDLVYGLCLKYIPDEARAKDAVMNLFEELVAKLPKHEVTHFRAWLFTVARNHCLMQLRGEKKMPLTTQFDSDHVQSGEMLHLMEEPDKEWTLDELDHCLKALAPDQRLMVELFYLKEKSYKEIALQTKVEWNTVRSNIQNGRRNLKLCLEKRKKNSLYKS